MDKAFAKSRAWEDKTILHKSYTKLLSEFAVDLHKSEYKGKIVNESAPDQDIHLISAHNKLSNIGVPGKVTPQAYRTHLTSLSFINKHDNNTEAELADIIAAATKIYYLSHKSKSNFRLSTRLSIIVSEKLASDPNSKISHL